MSVQELNASFLPPRSFIARLSERARQVEFHGNGAQFEARPSADVSASFTKHWTMNFTIDIH